MNSFLTFIFLLLSFSSIHCPHVAWIFNSWIYDSCIILVLHNSTLFRSPTLRDTELIPRLKFVKRLYFSSSTSTKHWKLLTWMLLSDRHMSADMTQLCRCRFVFEETLHVQLLHLLSPMLLEFLAGPDSGNKSSTTTIRSYRALYSVVNHHRQTV
jgi:hypothetical protein